VSRKIFSGLLFFCVFLIAFATAASASSDKVSKAKPKLLKFSSEKGLADIGERAKIQEGQLVGLVKIAPFSLDKDRVRLGGRPGARHLYIYERGYHLRTENGFLLPRKTVLVELPLGSKVTGVRLVGPAFQEVSGNLRRMKFRPVAATMKKTKDGTGAIKSAGVPNLPAPPIHLKYMAGNTRDKTRVSVWVYPVAYDATGDKAVLLTKGTIEVYYQAK